MLADSPVIETDCVTLKSSSLPIIELPLAIITVALADSFTPVIFIVAVVSPVLETVINPLLGAVLSEIFKRNTLEPTLPEESVALKVIL